MSKSVDHIRHHAMDDSQSHTPHPDGADEIGNKPARRDAAGGQNLLGRILEMPHLERVVPQLQPALLHRVIKTCGLEDCSELVALATPEQLAQVFDLDLWRAPEAGRDEQFDADRFGVWLEVLLEASAEVAAQKLAGMEVDLVVAGLAQHMLVYDHAAVAPYETLDGELVEVRRDDDDRLTSEVSGYLLVAKRTDSWEAIIEVLLALDAGHPDYFGRVMGGCRALSNAGREIDGLDDLLHEGEQAMFDLSLDREGRREKQGYVMPAQARAFLQMSRALALGGNAKPPVNPLARAYFREVSEQTEAAAYNEAALLAAGPEASPAAEETAAATAAVYEVLLDAGVIEQGPRALLGAGEAGAPRLSLIQAYMQFALDLDPAAYAVRGEEITYLANVLMAGCSIQTRAFTAQEASDAVVAVCNLGLENWPPHWLPANATALPAAFLVEHDLVGVFQVGWAVLHKDVVMYAAEQLIKALTEIRCDDRETQREVNALRSDLAKYWRAGMPWRACKELDVIATLDTLAWAVLLALIDECPTQHAGIGAAKDAPTLSVSATDFEFISENHQIVSIHEFLQALPEILRG